MTYRKSHQLTFYTLESLADAQPDRKKNAAHNEVQNQNKLHIAPPHAGRQLSPLHLPRGATTSIHVGGGSTLKCLPIVCHHDFLHLDHLMFGRLLINLRMTTISSQRRRLVLPWWTQSSVIFRVQQMLVVQIDLFLWHAKKWLHQMFKHT